MDINKLYIRYKWLTITALLICALVVSCSKNDVGTQTQEGSIKFKITYLKSEKEYPIISLLPTTLQMRFKNDNVILDLEGWLGIFKSSFVKNDKQQAYTLLKILNKRYLYTSKEGEGYYGINISEDAKIIYEDDTKEILGFKCRHAIVKLPNNTSFDVYYTPKIKVRNPTVNTPLDKIPGMLMEFCLNMNGIPMRLEAVEFHSDKIPDTAFDIPVDYENVPRSQMDDIFYGINK